ncbi:hypothetical protein V496_09398 [Pseudogymnoascus sp. VKM F-4515 (FW-2607)]|nr:hypothetical protein V496_09398 [Pseudogymnoascus sp. VKM F-4515 (FW-2607)]
MLAASTPQDLELLNIAIMGYEALVPLISSHLESVIPTWRLCGDPERNAGKDQEGTLRDTLGCQALGHGKGAVGCCSGEGEDEALGDQKCSKGIAGGAGLAEEKPSTTFSSRRS